MLYHKVLAKLLGLIAHCFISSLECRRVGGVDEVVHGLGKVVYCLREVSPRVIGRLNWMCSLVIILKWAICDIGPPVMVNGTYGTADFSPVFVIEQV